MKNIIGGRAVAMGALVLAMLIIGADAGAQRIAIAETQNTPPYSRDDYHRQWIDSDADCQNTRHEVLIAESIIAVTLRNGCRVIAGLWYDHYTGAYYRDPMELDIDHVVPLKEAHISGGRAWSAERKEAYAQDMSHAQTLIVVSKSANRAKGSKDPARWMPSNEAYHCQYLRTWIDIKSRWDLSADSEEYNSIMQKLSDCN